MIILNGKEVANALKREVGNTLDSYYKLGLPKCKLAIVMAGNDPASQVYVRNKTKACELANIESELVLLSEDATQEEVENRVKSLALDKSVHGVLVQLPLPKNLDGDRVTELVPYEKDVDGFTSKNLGELVLGNNRFLSCTPGGIIYMLKHYGIELDGKNAVVLGRSKIVGKPMALALLNENCTVTICHSKTQNLKEVCKSADILIVAIGKPLFVTSDMVKDGAVVVDVGINRTENGLTGDVDFKNVAEKCSFITPVPGGVGPMTVAYLMKNTLTAYEKALNIDKNDL